MIRFLHSLWIALLFTCLLVPAGYGQDTGQLTGTVRASDTQGPLPGANIAVVGTSSGTSTAADGTFRITGLERGQYNVRFSFIGYEGQTRSVTIRPGETTTLEVTLVSTQLVGEEVVVTGSKQQEKLLEAPVTVEAISAQDLNTSGGGTYLSALSNLKGVDFVNVGINGQGISARGFNNHFNTRMLQMKDGRVAQLPGTGLPQGNFLPTSQLDVKTIEVVVGPASALYGPNAHTGVVNVITKDPWDESGLALDVRGGQHDLFDLNGRAAGTINESFGWKVTGQYMQATDFRPPTGGPNAAASDSTHFFGTPFNERDLVEDYDINSIRAEGSLYYQFGDGWTATGAYGFSQNDNFGLTNNGRNRILDWQVQYQNLQLSSDHWFLQGTHTSNDAGDTYQINGVATGATAIFAGALENGATPSEALNAALSQLPSLRDDNRFVDRGELWDSEIQYRNSFAVGSGTIDIVTGGQLRDFQPDSDGTFLADANDEDISATEVGGYVQLDYRPTDKIRLNTAARVDNHSNYDTQFSPKAALVYTVAPNQNVRVGFNRAFKSPTILESNLLISGVFRGNIDGYTVSDATTNDVVRTIDPLDPEEVNSIEVGYKGVFGRRVFVDVVAYNSWYQNFISPLTNVSDPLGVFTGSPTGTLAFDDENNLVGEGTGLDGTLSTYFNFGEATVRGLDLGVEVQASDHLNLSGSLSLIDLADFEQGDAQQDLLLNVPNTKVKGSATVRDLGVEGWFASLSGRWQSAYAFRSGFWNSANLYDDGEVPSRFTASLTAGYTIPETGVSIKASATNLFDTERIDVLGAPQTERLFWVSATYNFRGLDV